MNTTSRTIAAARTTTSGSLIPPPTSASKACMKLTNTSSSTCGLPSLSVVSAATSRPFQTTISGVAKWRHRCRSSSLWQRTCCRFNTAGDAFSGQRTRSQAFFAEYQKAHGWRKGSRHTTTPDGKPLPERLLAGGFMLCGHYGAHMIGEGAGGDISGKWYGRRYQCRRHHIFAERLNATDCPGSSVSITGDVFEQVVWY